MYYFYTNLQATNLLNLKHTYFCAKKQRHTKKNYQIHRISSQKSTKKRSTNSYKPESTPIRAIRGSKSDFLKKKKKKKQISKLTNKLKRIYLRSDKRESQIRRIGVWI